MLEMHIGTYTEEATSRAAIDKRRHLAETGLTLIEIMPVAQFEIRLLCSRNVAAVSVSEAIQFLVAATAKDRICSDLIGERNRASPG